MLFVIYLGTTAYVWINTIKSMRDNDKRLKQEGYIFKCSKFSGLGDIIIGIGFAAALSIPVLNLIFPLINKDKDKSYDQYKNMLLDAGSIEKIELDRKDSLFYSSNTKTPKIVDNNESCEKIVVKEDAVNEENNILDIGDSRLTIRTNKDGHIYYSTKEKTEYETIDHGYTYKKEFKNRRY